MELPGVLVALLVVAAGVCGVLGLAEAITRVRYGQHLEYRVAEEILWELKPRQRGFTIAGRPKATINSLGFRGPEISLEPRCYRVLMVGDSFAFGYGVGDDETLAHFLERELRSHTGKECEVLNLGVPGYGVHQMIRLAENKLKEYRPNMVIMVMIRGDVVRQVKTSRRPQKMPARAVRALLRGSSFAALMKPHLEETKEWLGIGGRVTREWVEEAFDGLWERDRRRIERLHTLLRDQGIDFVFIPYISHSDDGDFAMAARRDLGPDILVVNGISPALQRYALEHGGVARIEEHPELRIQGDAHPTATSYRIAAEVIVDTLRRRNSGRAMERA